MTGKARQYWGQTLWLARQQYQAMHLSVNGKPDFVASFTVQTKSSLRLTEKFQIDTGVSVGRIWFFVISSRFSCVISVWTRYGLSLLLCHSIILFLLLPPVILITVFHLRLYCYEIAWFRGLGTDQASQERWRYNPCSSIESLHGFRQGKIGLSLSQFLSHKIGIAMLIVSKRYGAKINMELNQSVWNFENLKRYSANVASSASYFRALLFGDKNIFSCISRKF